MKITCLGAARTVTGSSYLVQLDRNNCFLVDCGLYQGGRQLEQRNWNIESHRPRRIKAIFITHAHIDHSGLVPRLVRMGYRGPVYASAATCELLKILWMDSAHIQEMEARWQSRKNKRVGRKEVEPLYETIDAQQAAELLVPVKLTCHPGMLPGLEVCFVGAGHILGASSLLLRFKRGSQEYRVGFSGDLGRPGQLIVPDPEKLPRAGMVFMETTYGNRLHKSLEQSQRELIEVINAAYREGGKVLIPAFAVERTQELIYIMAAAHRRGELPPDMPVFLDSPLAIHATEIFRKFPQFFDQDTKDLLADGKTPLNFPNLKFTLSTEESRQINEYRGPAVIMAGNGMASAGRIKHHLKHNLWRPNAHVVIVGFQAQGTTGRRLVEGADTVKIFREPVAVRAQVHTIGGFSAHADRDELLGWLEGIAHPGLRVNLIHGEEQSSLAFMQTAHNRFPQVKFHVPRWKESIKVPPSGAKAPAAVRPEKVSPAPELARRLAQAARRLEHLARQVEAGRAALSPQELAELERRLAEAERAAGLEA